MTLSIIGIDLAKRSFQVHGADKEGNVLFRRCMNCRKMAIFCAQLPPTVIAMEACATAHYWGRY